MDTGTILQIVGFVVTLAIGAGGTYYLVFKKKVHELATVFNDIDVALYDDKITEKEFRKIYEDGKALFTKGG